MNKNEEKIIEMLGEVLGIDDANENITLKSNLIDDLGAESIDFIDICFQLEKIYKFGKVATTDIFPDGLRDNAEYDEEKLSQVVKEYPYLEGKLLEEIKSKKSYEPVLSVSGISQFVEWRLVNAN